MNPTPPATELVFPDGFLWGTATSAHQVEGDNRNSDWWEWEHRPGSPCVEPSGAAIDHYRRYADDVALLAGLGFNTYRFSVEWARIEPEEGAFDVEQLNHYRRVLDAVLASGMAPMVTLNHFTIPRWLARRGGWRAPEAPERFGRYCSRVAEALGSEVPSYCTINEPGVVAFGGYLGALGFPPGTRSLRAWEAAIAGLVAAHRLAHAILREARPDARIGATHSMQEWTANAGGRPVLEFMRRMNEDVFLEACEDDDFIGVQTYTREPIELSRAVGAALGFGSRHDLGRRVLAQLLRRGSLDRIGLGRRPPRPRAGRVTQMGYEFRPEAVAATVRRVADLLPGREIVVTEHGVATADDAERIEFMTRGLVAIHGLIGQGLPVRGYIHWSAFDNFEWARGYGMRFGLVAVDRATMERRVKPSARFLGEIARRNRLRLGDEVPAGT